MLKKLFFIVIVCVGAYTLFQSSKLVATVIEKKMMNYSFDTKIGRAQERQVSQFARLGFDSTILLSPLFSVYESVPDASSDNDEEVAITSSPLLKKFELTGVILLGKDRSIAFIRKAGERESKVYHVGDKLDNAEITKIERDRVYVNDGAKTVVIPMFYKYMDKSLVKNDIPARDRAVSDDKYAATKQVKKVMSRSEVENKVFQKVNQILTQVAISPYMVNGQMEGLRLMRVPNDNIVFELGGRSGDIVRRVNGHEVNQIDQMYKLWENIKDDSFISVDLERNNQIYNYSFEIRE
jgi:type II secretion system protein C